MIHYLRIKIVLIVYVCIKKVDHEGVTWMSTVRKDIIEMLSMGKWAARDISKARHIPEKEVYDHLNHIKRSLKSTFKIKAAVCLVCGFRFSKRNVLKPPSRCPVCRAEHIQDPLFFCQRAPEKF